MVLISSSLMVSMLSFFYVPIGQIHMPSLEKMYSDPLLILKSDYYFYLFIYLLFAVELYELFTYFGYYPFADI